jgi:hypothetical protein
MLLKKKNFQDFYSEIRQHFPELKELETWNTYDWSINGCENYLIMTELCGEMVNRLEQGREEDAQKLMNTIERYFHEGDMPVTSIIYSDFLATIMAAKRESRELIKEMTGRETKRHYISLFKLYRESDT